MTMAISETNNSSAYPIDQTSNNSNEQSTLPIDEQSTIADQPATDINVRGESDNLSAGLWKNRLGNISDLSRSNNDWQNNSGDTAASARIKNYLKIINSANLDLSSIPSQALKIKANAKEAIVSAVRNSPNEKELLATLTSLQKENLLPELFSATREPGLRSPLLALLGNNINRADHETGEAIRQLIEPQIETMPQEWQVQYNLSRLGVTAPAGRFDYTQYKYLISADPAAPFTGSGATGTNPTQLDIPYLDQSQLLYEYKVGKGKAYQEGKENVSSTEVPTTAKYYNPLTQVPFPDYLASLTPEQRADQARLLLSQPISSVIASSYTGSIPTRADVIRAAAKHYNLEPELVAGVILAEQRDQSKNEDAADYLSATSVVNHDSSLGLGQVNVSTALKNDLFADLLLPSARKELTSSSAARLLDSDELNIFAVARYIRQVADQGATIPNSSFVNIRNYEDYKDLDTTAYANNSANWPAANIRMLGSEYTSKPWDGKTFTKWGYFVDEAYQDVKNSGVFK